MPDVKEGIENAQLLSFEQTVKENKTMIETIYIGQMCIPSPVISLNDTHVDILF